MKNPVSEEFLKALIKTLRYPKTFKLNFPVSLLKSLTGLSKGKDKHFILESSRDILRLTLGSYKHDGMTDLEVMGDLVPLPTEETGDDHHAYAKSIFFRATVDTGELIVPYDGVVRWEDCFISEYTQSEYYQESQSLKTSLTKEERTKLKELRSLFRSSRYKKKE